MVGRIRLVGVMLMMRSRGEVGCWSWSCVCLLVSYLSRAVLYQLCKCIQRVTTSNDKKGFCSASQGVELGMPGNDKI